MAWFKVDDGFWSHPKVLTMSADATSLWVRSGAYACQHLTDGFIAEGLLHVLGSDRAAEELVESGLWLEADGGFLFHDWDDYQETADAVKRRREQARERQRKFREERENKKNVTPNVTRDSKSDESGSSQKVSTPDPTRPDPTRPDHSSSSAKPPAVAKPPREDVEQLCTRLRDHIAGNTSKTPNITAKWRTEARLLLDRDDIPFDEAVRVLDWCQADSFWKGNILSMPKFREKFAQLQIKSRQSLKTSGTRGSGYDAADWLRPSTEPDFDYIDAEVVQLREIGR